MMTSALPLRCGAASPLPTPSLAPWLQTPSPRPPPCVSRRRPPSSRLR
jgi:hypothetical protein